MGTAVSISVLDPLDPSVVEEAFDEIRRLEALFSRFRVDSEISRIGRGDLGIEDADPLVQGVLERCDRLAAETRGAFAHRYRSDGREILDPAAYVKGWAGDRAGAVLSAGGARRYSLNVGGDVLAAGGTGKRPWRIGVRHPDHADAVMATLRIVDGAVATSGAYERGEHVRRRRSELRSVTVVGPELAMADALATAVFSSGSSAPPWFDSFPDYELMVVAGDRMFWTRGVDGMLEMPGGD